MKANHIITKKVSLFVLLICLVGMRGAFAQIQNYSVATLQHNDSIKVFYGSNAFKNANAAASNGDTITLSGGNFNGDCTVSKAITIHGAGCVMDSAAGVAPTVVTDEFRISQTNDTLSLFVEGICFSGTIRLNTSNSGNYTSMNVYILKCDINSVYIHPYTSPYNHYNCYLNNSRFEDCIIKGVTISGKGLTFTNCVMNLSTYSQTDRYNPNTIVNSVVLLNNNTKMENSLVLNSIIKTADDNSHTNSSFFNCINIKKGNSSIFEDQNYSTNMEVDDYVDVFETFDGTVTYDNIYQLRNEIVNTFLGSDGTQVGIYGGTNPYNSHLPYMILKRCNVAGSTDSDNKLSIEIELKDNNE